MQTKKRILILGAGFGGISLANSLRSNPVISSDGHQITIIDQKDYFMMGLVNLWILSGIRTLEDSRTPLSKLKDKGIRFLHDKASAIDFLSKTVTVGAASDVKLEYDYLVIALGTEYALEKVSGFSESGGFNLYDPEQIPSLRERILSLKNGKIAICITSVPYKCPPAPYEAALLINNILVKNGSRDSVSLDIYTPTSIALPVAGEKVSQSVVDILNKNEIGYHPSHKVKEVLDNGKIEFENGNRVDYDVLIGIPPHEVPSIVRKSGLVKQGQNFVNINRYTLETEYENVFAIGDVNEIKVDGNLFIPKAGIFAESEAKVVSQLIIDDIRTKSKSSLSAKFDGKGFCFMETGNQKAGYVAADFYNEKGPTALLEPPSEESYRKKIDFERKRLSEWF
ncbi:MAG TPA: FAD/NAD(P)-binding oxidoreductase [Nitrososphaeraceae archaeon]|nr:FAD/NAD(P)-binding oxidoreductase [Nitrososphaeraceae archaeon]